MKIWCVFEDQEFDDGYAEILCGIFTTKVLAEQRKDYLSYLYSSFYSVEERELCDDNQAMFNSFCAIDRERARNYVPPSEQIKRLERIARETLKSIKSPFSNLYSNYSVFRLFGD